ncbi:MAG: metallophosphoesterase family protein [Faecalimonas sp.]|nr:metallophosphoesterase family protein [Faecalimonas sp.]
MRILAIADEESPYLWDYFEKSKLEGIDLIISCGDLDARYLSFLATFTSAPVLYVHGNHDDKYKDLEPEGCICIEDKIYVHNGVRILGLGGSMRYHPGEHQYSEKEMKKRARHRKLRRQIRKHKGFDILVTHAPAYGVNDGEDLPHRGFEEFLRLMELYAPKFFLHGHVHLRYGLRHKRCDKYLDTTIINACERYVFDFEES